MIGLVVDNPKRDLNGLVLVSYELAARGVSSALVPMYQQGVEVPLLGLNAVVLNYARPNNRPLIESYKRLGLSVFILDTEGGILSAAGLDSPSNWARVFRESGIASYIDGYFFWGEEVGRAFERESALPLERIHVTGCPRFDFCHEPLRQILDFPRSGYILVNTNFSGINPYFTPSESEEREVFVAAGWEPGYVDTMLGDMRKAFAGYLDAIEHLARALPHQAVLIRPHPFENSKLYDDRFVGLANVIVDGRENVHNAISRSRCVVHLNCGTAIESVMMERVPLSLEFLNSDRLRDHAPLPSRVSYHVADPADLVRAVEDIETIARSFPFREHYRRFIQTWFHLGDGAAASRIAQVLASACKSPPVRNIAASFGSGFARPSPMQRLQGLAASILGPKRIASLRARHESTRRSKEFSIGEVEAILQKLAGTSPRNRGAQAIPTRHPATKALMSSIAILPG